MTQKYFPIPRAVAGSVAVQMLLLLALADGRLAHLVRSPQRARLARLREHTAGRAAREKAAAAASKAVLEPGNLYDPAEVAAKFEATKLERICDACGKTEAQANAEKSKLRHCTDCKMAKCVCGSLSLRESLCV